MKYLFFILTSYHCLSQSKVGINVSFANNRVTGGIEFVHTKKIDLGLCLNAGLLAKDELSYKRGDLYSRLFNKNSSHNYFFPFYDPNNPNFNKSAEGYKATFIGTKCHILIGKTKIINSSNLFSFKLIIGFFYSYCTWQPTYVNYQPFDEILPNNKKTITQKVSGIYSGIDLSHQISLNRKKNYYISYGIILPFYFPRIPVSYRRNGSSPMLSGLEAEIKISLVKKI